MFKKIFKIGSLCVFVLGLSSSPLVAQSTHPSQIAADEVTDAQVMAFVNAVFAIKKVRDEHTPRIEASSEDKSQQKVLIEKANTAAAAAVNRVENMDFGTYAAIANAAKDNEALEKRITARMDKVSEEAKKGDKMSTFGYITLTTNMDIKAKITLNGFTITKERIQARMNWTDVLNDYIVKDNTLKVSLSALEQESKEDFKVSLRLSLHEKGTMVSKETGRPLEAKWKVSSGQLTDTEDNNTFVFQAKDTLEASAQFSNFGGLDFSDRLLNNKLLGEDRAIQEATKLLDAVRDGDFEAFWNMTEPSNKDEALVYSYELSELKKIKQEIMKEFHSKFNPADADGYNLTAVRQGNLVEVLRNGGPLLTAKDEDSSSSMGFLFGWVDDEVKVLR